MDSAHFDALTARLAAPLTRRRSVGLLAILGLGGFIATDDASARKHKKKHKRAKRPTCTPNCDRRICGSDGCGGTCGTCPSCQECQGGVCVLNANGTACGDACHECQGGACVARADGTTCGADSCQTCQGGQCVAKLDSAPCPEASPAGQCRRGACRARPLCVSYGNEAACQAQSCCYQDEFDICPEFCLTRAISGHRCVIDADCESGVCSGYACA